MEYFDIISQILNDNDDINANIYEKGNSENEQLLLVEDRKSAEKLNTLIKDEIENLVDEIDKRDYDCFWLDYATEDNWTYYDEAYVCDECYKAYLRREYNACEYADYYIGDGWLLCGNCVKEQPDDYIQSLINEPTRANTILDYEELTSAGFEKVNDYPFANGWYGQQDSPKEIMAKAKQMKPKSQFIFNIRKNYNPFECEFDLYEREVS